MRRNPITRSRTRYTEEELGQLRERMRLWNAQKRELINDDWMFGSLDVRQPVCREAAPEDVQVTQ